MLKQIQRKIIQHINPAIKVGDKVKIKDGSYLTICNPNIKILTEFGRAEKIFIPYAYPELTGRDEIIKDMVIDVLETNVNYKLEAHPNVANYDVNLDVKIRIGNLECYTCSNFLYKVSEHVKDCVQENIEKLKNIISTYEQLSQNDNVEPEVLNAIYNATEKMLDII